MSFGELRGSDACVRGGIVVLRRSCCAALKDSLGTRRGTSTHLSSRCCHCQRSGASAYKPLSVVETLRAKPEFPKHVRSGQGAFVLFAPAPAPTCRAQQSAGTCQPWTHQNGGNLPQSKAFQAPKCLLHVLQGTQITQRQQTKVGCDW